MKFSFFYSLFLIICCSNSLVAQNYYYTLDESQEEVPGTGTVISNVNELIAGLKSGANLYLKSGNYQLKNTLYLDNLSNITLTGQDGATITGNLVTLFQFRNSANNISFNNIRFNSTSSYTGVDNGVGIVYFDGSAENILFENCEFTSPKVVSNGLKFSAYPSSRSKNITIHKCHFYDIGRMAIETQNHNSDDIPRITDVKVTECNFERLGLQSPYGMAVSLSGSGKNADVSNNTISDAKDIGIENAGWNNITINNNTFSSSTTYGYGPITCENEIADGGDPYIRNVVVSGNSGTVRGTANHLVGMNNCDGLIYRNNSFNADALYFGDVQNSTIEGNTHYSDGGIGLYVDENSSYNTFENNTFVTTSNYVSTVSFYPGSTGNKLINNTLRKEGQGGILFNDMDGGNLRQ